MINFPKELDPKWVKMVTELWDTGPSRSDKGPGHKPPKGWRRVDEDRFCMSRFFSHTPVFTMYRNDVQDLSMETISRFGSPHGHWWHGNYLHYYDGTGVHITSVYQNGKSHVEFYLFGCEHRYTNKVILGNCHYKVTCERCSHVEDVDSSD